LLIGRGYIAIDLDTKGAKEALAAFRKEVEAGMKDVEKKRKTDIDGTAAREDLKKTETELDKTKDKAEKTDGAFSKLTGSLRLAGLWLGVFVPAAGLASSSLINMAGGALALVGAVGNLTGVIALAPAGIVAAAGAMATLTLGMHGFSAGLKTAMSGNATPKALAKALSDLAPSARDTVIAIAGMKDGFKTLRLDVQQQLFLGLAGTIKQLGAADMPILHTALTGFAQTLNGVVKDIVAFVKTAQELRDFSATTRQIKTTFDALRPAVVAVLQAFFDIATVGSRSFPSLAERITVIAQRFAEFVRQARESGQLEAFIQRGIAAFKQLGAVIGNVSRILYDLWAASSAAGFVFIGGLEKATAALAAFLKTGAGQNDLKEFLDSASESGKALQPILITLGKGFLDLLKPLDALTKEIAPALNTFLKGLDGGIKNLGPGVLALGVGLSALLNALAPLLPIFGQLISSLVEAAVPGIEALAFVLRALTPVLRAIADSFDSVVQHTGPLLSILALATAAILAFRSVLTLTAEAGAITRATALIGGAIDGLALKSAVWAASWGTSAQATGRMTAAGASLSGTLTSVGKALPFIGIAVIGLSLAFQASAEQAKALNEEVDSLAHGLVSGGQAAVEAANKLAGLQAKIDDLSRGKAAAAGGGPVAGPFDFLGKLFGTDYQSQLDEYTKTINQAQSEIDATKQKYAELVASLGPVGVAQAKAAQATKDYNDALARYGPNSSEAASAQDNLKRATEDEADAEYYAKRATESHTQSMRELQDQALAAIDAASNLKLADLDLADAQRAAAEATKSHGAESEESVRAGINLEQAYNRDIKAAYDMAAAQNAGLEPSKQAAAATSAQTQKILGLSLAAGVNAPASLRQLAADTYNANEAAITAAVATGRFKDKILELPDGRLVHIAVDDHGTPVIQDLQNRTDNLTLPAHRLEFLADTHQATSAINSLLALVDQANTGFVYGFPVGHHALGGQAPAGQPFIAGEQGPELIFPSRDSYVVPSAQTRQMLSSPDASGSTKVEQNNYFQPGLSEQVVADMAANSLAFRLKQVTG
jgi:phage-related protein